MKYVFFSIAILLTGCIKGYTNDLPPSVINSVIQLIQAKKYEQLINEYFSDVQQIRFVPHSMLSKSDLSLSKNEIMNYWNNDESLHWGTAEGSGLPIDFSIKEYFAYFVSLDKNAKLKTSINKRILDIDGSENVYKEYERSTIVDVLADWNDPYKWHGMKIIFQLENGVWRIICLVMSRWEI